MSAKTTAYLNRDITKKVLGRSKTYKRGTRVEIARTYTPFPGATFAMAQVKIGRRTAYFKTRDLS